LCAATAVVAVLAAFGAHAAEAFKVRLTPVPIEASTAAKTKGSGRASASLDGSTLTVMGSFAGLVGPATVAALHEGPVLGVRGPSVADFTVPQAASGSFNALFKLTPAQLTSLHQGRLYLQIHSAAAPDGNLWGWLLP
jgi:CHRD domain-containing protein